MTRSATAWAPSAPRPVATFSIAHAAAAPRHWDLPAARWRWGETADIVVLDDTHPALAGRRQDQLIDAWVFAAGDGAVHTVFAGGHRVVADGRHIGRDAIRQRFDDTMRRLLERS